MLKKFRFFAATVLALIALPLSGCAPANSIVANSAAGIGLVGAVSSLNPDIPQSKNLQFDEGTGPDSQLAALTKPSFGNVGLDGVFEPNSNFGSIELLTEEPFVVRYQLTGDATWSDGTPVTVADLALSWVAASDPVEAGFKSVRATGPLDFAVDVPRIDEENRSIDIQFAQPVSDYQTALTVPVAAHVISRLAFGDENLEAAAASQRIISAITSLNLDDLKALAESYNKAFKYSSDLSVDSSVFVSAGPYRVSALDAGSISLSARSDFTWGKPPKIETLKLLSFENSLEALAALQAGELALFEAAPSDQLQIGQIVEALSQATDVNTQLQARPVVTQIVLNGADDGIFSSTRFSDPIKLNAIRTAMLEFIPAKKISAAIASQVLVFDAASFAVASADSNYLDFASENGSSEFGIQNAEAAAEQLKESGINLPAVVRVLYDADDPNAQIAWALLSERAAQAGFALRNLATSDPSSLLESGNYDLHITNLPLIGDSKTASVRAWQQQLNLVAIDSPVVSDLAELSATTDAAARIDLLKRIDSALFETRYGLPLYQPSVIFAVAKTLTGYQAPPTGLPATWNYWNWQVPVAETPASG